MNSINDEMNFKAVMPNKYQSAHNLCFLIHDIMLQALRSGEAAEIFMTKLKISHEDEVFLKSSNDVFDWLDVRGRTKDKEKIIRATVLQAVLSDALHCIYEALKCSEKGKLNISYMLIRKPIQETLYLIESLFMDGGEFSKSLSEDPLTLRPKNAGGIDNHIKRVSKVVTLLGCESRFSGDYIARLRYDKNTEDNFDGICNLAMHLFTEHRAIKTKKLNVNFIFSDFDSKLSQWSYLYSRLPYILYYFYIIVECILSTIAKTPNTYILDMQRRITASICLWWEDVDEDYKSDELIKFYTSSKLWLDQHCIENGFNIPDKKDLIYMMNSGAFPNESDELVETRHHNFTSMHKSGMKK
ncbi:hypothetical protein [Edwardsiella anguillarum]|uniref:hypothetical protein n=1 Tax=Edwardsiella anguillarum TaxID=1821960 RepID=UPI0024B82B65|nr:hypothetical protein [Edwardsiella anguillarum]WHQ15439.1 hypothetical protein MQ083_06630 [Edwardsiella anguillarum]